MVAKWTLSKYNGRRPDSWDLTGKVRKASFQHSWWFPISTRPKYTPQKGATPPSKMREQTEAKSPQLNRLHPILPDDLIPSISKQFWGLGEHLIFFNPGKSSSLCHQPMLLWAKDQPSTKWGLLNTAPASGTLKVHGWRCNPCKAIGAPLVQTLSPLCAFARGAPSGVTPAPQLATGVRSSQRRLTWQSGREATYIIWDVKVSGQGLRVQLGPKTPTVPSISPLGHVLVISTSINFPISVRPSDTLSKLPAKWHASMTPRCPIRRSFELLTWGECWMLDGVNGWGYWGPGASRNSKKTRKTFLGETSAWSVEPLRHPDPKLCLPSPFLYCYNTMIVSQGTAAAAAHRAEVTSPKTMRWAEPETAGPPERKAPGENEVLHLAVIWLMSQEVRGRS